jgi:iron(III) transport system permease protein
VFLASITDNETGDPTLANYARILGYPYYLRALRNSLIVGFGGMTGAVLLGVPLAYLTTRYAIRGLDLIATLAVLALVSPPFIGAYAWIMMLGNNFARRSDRRPSGSSIGDWNRHQPEIPQ